MATDHFDDPRIPGEARLFRRIHLTHVVKGGEGQSALSSAAFRDLELSVNLESVMSDAGRTPEDSLKDNPNDFLASISAAVCRSNRQLVGPDPLPSEPAHAYAFGKKPNRIRRALRDAASWVVPATAPPWEEIRLRKEELGISTGELGED